MWDPVRAGLAERARVITPDLPGDLVDPPSLEAVAVRLVGLLDELGLDRCDVGGASLGGYVLMALLRVAPERVGRVLFAGTKAVADTPEAARGRFELADRVEREGASAAAGMAPNLVSDPGLAPRLQGWIGEQPAAAVAWTARAMAARPDSRETLRALDLDALVVHGERDAVMGVEVAEDIAALTGGQLVVVPGAGHLVPVEAPEAFLGAVLPWLAR
ncbi:hypothetical protein BJP25_26395 [Actinokineospora bangkokensis]|uniref:AB hydrolase-1 domain-containing protein n=2 Tax=Actinokineospora bangkokensis TaxID=1193682 RepID=A0A1Q9LHK3_9PSEU|nr:hypothetical protein BJP25_26395 [Actinokineospora bangkokensis]